MARIPQSVSSGLHSFGRLLSGLISKWRFAFLQLKVLHRCMKKIVRQERQWGRAQILQNQHGPAKKAPEALIAKTNDSPLRLYGLFTLTTRVCSTIGSMSDDEQGRSGANLLLLCLAALIFCAVIFMGFELTALP